MSTESFREKSSAFTEEQRTVLLENTKLSIMSGLAVRYHEDRKELTARVERVANECLDEPFAHLHADIAKVLRSALEAEVPLAFSLGPSNLSRSIVMLKINPQSGEPIYASDVQIGLVGGLSGDGKFREPFTSEDVELALERMQAQQEVGIYFNPIQWLTFKGPDR